MPDWNAPPFNLYSNAPVPPVAVAVSVVVPPLHPIVPAETDAKRLQAGELTVVVAVAVHPFASFTITLYEPAVNPVAVIVVCTGVLFHE